MRLRFVIRSINGCKVFDNFERRMALKRIFIELD
jgi:hypothetical protein